MKALGFLGVFFLANLSFAKNIDDRFNCVISVKTKGRNIGELVNKDYLNMGLGDLSKDKVKSVEKDFMGFGFSITVEGLDNGFARVQSEIIHSDVIFKGQSYLPIDQQFVTDGDESPRYQSEFNFENRSVAIRCF